MTKQAYISLDRDMDNKSVKHYLDERPRQFWFEVIPGLFGNQTMALTQEQCISVAIRNVVNYLPLVCGFMSVLFIL